MKRALLCALFCCATVSWAVEQRPVLTRRPPGQSPPPAETPALRADENTPPDSVTPPPAPQNPTAVPGTPPHPATIPNTPTAATAPPNAPSEPVAAPEPPANSPEVTAEPQGARELPLDSEPFDVRVHRRVAEYGQRHADRETRMASYEKATGDDPALARFADPRKVQVELSDELDREQTSGELAADYAEQSRDIQNKAQALQEFIAKRQQTLDELNHKNVGTNRQDLEVALANLAHQPSSPETLVAMREIDGRLSETDRNEKDLPLQLAQNKQEAADAANELTKLQALQQAYDKESKSFTVDALSARQNRLRLANKLEYFVVRSQAEDTLEQGRKSLTNVEHLAPSPEVENLLAGPAAGNSSDAHVEQMRDCINKSGDVQGCREASHRE